MSNFTWITKSKNNYSAIIFALQGTLYSSFREETETENFRGNKLRNIYFFHNLINKLFSEENQVPGTLFEAKKGGRVRHI